MPSFSDYATPKQTCTGRYIIGLSTWERSGMSPLSIPTCCNKTNELQNLFAFVKGRDAQKANNIKRKSCKKHKPVHIHFKSLQSELYSGWL